MTTEEKAKAYDEALKRAKAAIDIAADKDLVKGVATTIFPELTESEDEKIRKGLINFLQSPFIKENLTDEKVAPWIAYLEKQKELAEKEYVFRPLAGTDITIAAEQAIRRANEGDSLVLAFNGVYLPVRKDCNANKIVDIYDAFIEKQREREQILNFDVVSSWLRDHARRYVNSEFNEFHHCVEYDGTIDVERLIADLKVAVGGNFDVF